MTRARVGLLRPPRFALGAALGLVACGASTTGPDDDGSERAPFASIMEAVRAIEPGAGSQIAIGAGIYLENVFLTDLLRDARLDGALMHGGAATFFECTWSDNGVDLVQQACDGEPVSPGAEQASSAEICLTWDRLVLPLELSPWPVDARAM